MLHTFSYVCVFVQELLAWDEATFEALRRKPGVESRAMASCFVVDPEEELLADIQSGAVKMDLETAKNLAEVTGRYFKIGEADGRSVFRQEKSTSPNDQQLYLWFVGNPAQDFSGWYITRRLKNIQKKNELEGDDTDTLAVAYLGNEKEWPTQKVHLPFWKSRALWRLNCTPLGEYMAVFKKKIEKNNVQPDPAPSRGAEESQENEERTAQLENECSELRSTVDDLRATVDEQYEKVAELEWQIEKKGTGKGKGFEQPFRQQKGGWFNKMKLLIEAWRRYDDKAVRSKMLLFEQELNGFWCSRARNVLAAYMEADREDQLTSNFEVQLAEAAEQPDMKRALEERVQRRGDEEQEDRRGTSDLVIGAAPKRQRRD